MERTLGVRIPQLFYYYKLVIFVKGDPVEETHLD